MKAGETMMLPACTAQPVAINDGRLALIIANDGAACGVVVFDPVDVEGFIAELRRLETVAVARRRPPA